MKKIVLLFPIICPLLLGCNNGNKTKVYSFTFRGEHCSLNNEAQYEEDSKINLTLTVTSDDYMIPVELNDITMDGKKLTKDSNCGC